ncbi:hypothetical protein NKI61_31350 [Mesorhizobium sp. M0514]|uniref:hypothetical protein n=1 Tax=Mesorhizobium sp. M0514 TaxID=2956955 RepID=UPI00333DFC27
MAKKQTLFQHIWPRRISKRSAYELRRLDDVEFKKLKSATAKRSRKGSASSSTPAKKVARNLEIKRRHHLRRRYSRAMLLAKPKPNDILDALLDNRKSRWLRFNRRKHGVRIECRQFSFIDNPEETFRTLRKIAEADCNAIDYEVNFEDEHVLDIAPFLVFGMMVEGMAPMTGGGTVFGPTRKVLEAVGLREFLNIKPFGRMRMDDVWPLPLMQRRRAGTSKSRKIAIEPTTLEIRADQITKKINEWLGELGSPKELTDHGRGRLKSIVTETLNNAERHGRDGGDGEWIVAGFMARQPYGANTGSANNSHVCHLSFLNLGNSIAHTISGAPEDTLDQIDRYCKLHKKIGRRETTLATVFALQDGVSRLRQGADGVSGGTGLMDMVEFANELGRETSPGLGPHVAILSGDAYVKFEAPFNEGFGSSESERRLQWFNEGNVVSKPPNDRFVRDLPGYFPGTLITMRFILDASIQAASKKDG